MAEKNVSEKESIPHPSGTEKTGEDEGGASDPYLDELDSSIDLIDEEPTRYDIPAPEKEPPAPAKKATRKKAPPAPKAKPAEDARALAADIPVAVYVVVGEKKLSLAEILKLKKGEVLELASGLDATVDLMVQDKVVARGELVEVEGHLGVRLLRVLEESS